MSHLISVRVYPCIIRYGYEFKDSDPSFNAGVFAINLELWRKGKFVDEALYWMKQVAIIISLLNYHLLTECRSSLMEIWYSTCHVNDISQSVGPVGSQVEY